MRRGFFYQCEPFALALTIISLARVSCQLPAPCSALTTDCGFNGEMDADEGQGHFAMGPVLDSMLDPTIYQMEDPFKTKFDGTDKGPTGLGPLGMDPMSVSMGGMFDNANEVLAGQSHLSREQAFGPVPAAILDPIERPEPIESRFKSTLNGVQFDSPLDILEDDDFMPRVRGKSPRRLKKPRNQKRARRPRKPKRVESIGESDGNGGYWGIKIRGPGINNNGTRFLDHLKNLLNRNDNGHSSGSREESGYDDEGAESPKKTRRRKLKSKMDKRVRMGRNRISNTFDGEAESSGDDVKSQRKKNNGELYGIKFGFRKRTGQDLLRQKPKFMNKNNNNGYRDHYNEVDNNDIDYLDPNNKPGMRKLWDRLNDNTQNNINVDSHAKSSISTVDETGQDAPLGLNFIGR